MGLGRRAAGLNRATVAGLVGLVLLVGLSALSACSGQVQDAPAPGPAASPPTQTSVTSDDSSPAISRDVVPGSRLKPIPLPLAGRVVVVDPGHNGRYDSSFNNHLVPAGNGAMKACNTSGTATDAGWPEHAYTWVQGQALVDELRARGATVVLTRPDDDGLGPCVDERAAVANDAGADLSISIHADGNLAAGARGFHVITSATMTGGSAVEEASSRFAIDVREELLADTAMPVSTYIGGGTGLSPRSDIGGLNLLDATPGVMVEMGNMRNLDDVALLASPEFRHAAAVALADAAEDFLDRAADD